jgi:cytoskeleton protein RodZ
MMQIGPLTPDNSMPEGDRGCGMRLRRAREAAGLTQSDVASRLKMPVSVVQSLEVEDWSRLGAPVFVRGQLRSYSRLLGLTTAPMVAASGVGMVEPPVLVPRTYTPPMRRLAEQLGRRLVYVVLTAAIIVPVWLATRPHLGIVAHDSAPLDVPLDPRAIHVGAAEDASAQDPRPIVASLAPMSTASAGDLSLRLGADSWVQVTAPDGHLLRKALSHAGEELRYPLEEVGGVVIGNAAAVSVRRNGRPVDLTPYLRSNVARFTVSSAGSLSPVAD